MDLEVDWYIGGLAADCYHTMIQQEDRLCPFKLFKLEVHRNSEAYWIRDRIIDAIHSISRELPHRRDTNRKYALTTDTIHLGMHLFDKFVERFEVKEQRAPFVAVVALCIAAKVEEQDLHQPLPGTLLHRLSKCLGVGQYLQADYLKYEAAILRMCDFRMIIPTAPHFLPYFVSHVLCEDDIDRLELGDLPEPSAEYKEYLDDYEMFFPPLSFEPYHRFRQRDAGDEKRVANADTLLSFENNHHPVKLELHQHESCHDDFMPMVLNMGRAVLDLSLRAVELRAYPPSVVAASAVLVCRLVLQLEPIWHYRLHNVTGYDFEHLRPCAEKLHILFTRYFGTFTARTPSTSSSISSATVVTVPSPPSLPASPIAIGSLPPGADALLNMQHYANIPTPPMYTPVMSQCPQVVQASSFDWTYAYEPNTMVPPFHVYTTPSYPSLSRTTTTTWSNQQRSFDPMAMFASRGTTNAPMPTYDIPLIISSSSATTNDNHQGSNSDNHGLTNDNPLATNDSHVYFRAQQQQGVISSVPLDMYYACPDSIDEPSDANVRKRRYQEDDEYLVHRVAEQNSVNRDGRLNCPISFTNSNNNNSKDDNNNSNSELRSSQSEPTCTLVNSRQSALTNTQQIISQHRLNEMARIGIAHEVTPISHPSIDRPDRNSSSTIQAHDRPLPFTATTAVYHYPSPPKPPSKRPRRSRKIPARYGDDGNPILVASD